MLFNVISAPGSAGEGLPPGGDPDVTLTLSVSIKGTLFYVISAPGSAGEGLPPGGDPDVTLTLSVEDMQDMFVGNTKPLQAYMSGRLRVSGDLSAALRLDDFVKRVVDKLRPDT